MTHIFLGTGDRVMNKLGKYIILNTFLRKETNMKLIQQQNQRAIIM